MIINKQTIVLLVYSVRNLSDQMYGNTTAADKKQQMEIQTI